MQTFPIKPLGFVVHGSCDLVVKVFAIECITSKWIFFFLRRVHSWYWWQSCPLRERSRKIKFYIYWFPWFQRVLRFSCRYNTMNNICSMGGNREHKRKITLEHTVVVTKNIWILLACRKFYLKNKLGHWPPSIASLSKY